MLLNNQLVLNAYLKKSKKSQTTYFILYTISLELEKRRTNKTNVNRRKKITKIRAERNETETKKIIEKINETKGWFIKKINEIEKPLDSQRRERRPQNQK